MNETPLEKSILEMVKKNIRNDNNYRSKNIHVTAITQPCMRRTYYDITQPKKEIAYESAAIFTIGKMVHAGIVLNPDGNEIHMAANIRTMEPIDVKDINVINYFDCVSGSMDHLVNVNGEDIIIDLKTWSALTSKGFKWGGPKEESEDYINQVNIYKLLYWINHKKEIKRACIAHLDTASRLSDIRVFEINLQPIEVIQKMVLDKLDQLKGGKVPNRFTSWRCDYCPHNTKEICNPESEGNFKLKPKDK